MAEPSRAAAIGAAAWAARLEDRTSSSYHGLVLVDDADQEELIAEAAALWQYAAAGCRQPASCGSGATCGTARRDVVHAQARRIAAQALAAAAVADSGATRLERAAYRRRGARRAAMDSAVTEARAAARWLRRVAAAMDTAHPHPWRLLAGTADDMAELGRTIPRTVTIDGAVCDYLAAVGAL